MKALKMDERKQTDQREALEGIRGYKKCHKEELSEMALADLNI